MCQQIAKQKKYVVVNWGWISPRVSPELWIWWCFLLLQLNGFQSLECVVVKKSQYMYKIKTWYHGKYLYDSASLYHSLRCIKNSLVRFFEHHNSWIKIVREYFPWDNLYLTELNRSVKGESWTRFVLTTSVRPRNKKCSENLSGNSQFFSLKIPPEISKYRQKFLKIPKYRKNF